MVEPPLGRIGAANGLSQETQFPCADLDAPQNRHKIAASWISSAQNGHFTTMLFSQTIAE